MNTHTTFVNFDTFVRLSTHESLVAFLRKLSSERDEYRHVLEYGACPGLDDGDFHSKGRFELAETFIAVANRNRAVLEKWK